jgi:hypothetical protein
MSPPQEKVLPLDLDRVTGAVAGRIDVHIGGINACRERIQALKDGSEVQGTLDTLASTQLINSQGDYATEVNGLHADFATVVQNLDALLSSTIQILDNTSGLFVEGDTFCGSLFNGG